jgi:Sodium/hydrogen exchanger family
VTTDQVLFGIGLILLLAVGSQVLASRLRIPALIILLPAGFMAGALTTDVNPQRLLAPAFQPLVSLAVAVILYDAGLALDLGKLRGHTRRVVRRLITAGVPVTWVFAGLLLGMSAKAALMIGAILVVSGPTVVGPLLRFIRPTERLQRVLAWEGSLSTRSAASSARWCSTPCWRAPAGCRVMSWRSSSSPWPSAGPGRSSASHCCGFACARSISARCSAPLPSSPAWSRWRPSAISRATTPG